MVKVFASSSSWIEGSAVQQLDQTAALPGMREVVGMPDLHPGKGAAVGTAALSEGIIYPHLIGNDIGCGYSLFQTNIPAEKIKPEKLADRITGIDSPWDGDIKEFLSNYGVTDETIVSMFGNVLGTVGGGNHFAELQRIEDIRTCYSIARGATAHKDVFYGLNLEFLVLLVHSGSRSFGEYIFNIVSPVSKSVGLKPEQHEFSSYMSLHDMAVRFASANRELIAKRLLTCLEAEGDLLVDLPHNFLERHQDGFLHRKGAAPSNRGLSPLPGSRGTPTYLLTPSEEKHGLASLAHGAGRKSSRANMHGRVTESAKQMERTQVGSIVVCGSETLMREEHHSAYKPVDRVLADLTENKLAHAAAKMVPVLTYKSERQKPEKSTKREKERDWRDERRKSNRS